VTRDEAPSCPSRALENQAGMAIYFRTKSSTTIFNEVFLIGSTQSAKRSEPKSCVSPGHRRLYCDGVNRSCGVPFQC